MNFKPLGTAGTGSVLGEYYLTFFYMFEPLDMAQQLMDGLVFASYYQ
jgi:hypothetical protein